MFAAPACLRITCPTRLISFPHPPAGRIFEFVHGEDSAAPLLGPSNLPQVVEALLLAIRDAPHIAEKVRFAASLGRGLLRLLLPLAVRLHVPGRAGLGATLSSPWPWPSCVA